MHKLLLICFFFPIVLSSQSSEINANFDLAELKVHPLFTNHMVLQRDQPIHIWGKALPGAVVKVAFFRSTASTRVKTDSSWSVYLPAQKASTTPHEMKIISGKKNIRIRNVLIGDIWLCIGQSNMEWPMQREMHYREAIATAQQPLLRFYNPSYAGKNVFNQYFTDSVVKDLTPERFLKGQWKVSDSNSFKSMSAVAYYFGKQIVSETKVPIGLIHLSIGGAPLETFISIEAMKSSAQFASKTQEPWLTNPTIPTWVKERGNQNLRTGTNHPFKPGFAYAAAIEPLFKMSIKGIINYQGESNAQEIERVNEYTALTALMVQDYRTRFKQPTMPYYFVQLSSIDTVKYKGHLWPQFRDEQRKTLALIPYSGMAVSSDIGAKNDVHPTNKKVVGERLARWALNQTYHQNLVPSGPLPIAAKYQNGILRISFQYIGKGLKAVEDLKLNGFSLDGINPDEASIHQNEIQMITATKPEFVYYGWKSYSNGNLVNSEGLPASTFKLRVN